MKRMLATVASCGILAAGAIGSSAASAAPPSPDRPAGHASGVLVARGHSSHTSKPARPKSGNNLSYHGGPVMHGNTVYLLFWNPNNAGTWATGYQSLIQRYFTDVAHDTTAGAQSNVYYAATQYTDGLGAAGIATTVGGTASSSDNPGSQCSDSGTVYCVTDSEIASEVGRAVSANHWQTGPNAEVFVFTAKGIGSCAGSQCAFTYYCAYHSWSGSGSAVQLYANMPYADTNPNACDAGYHPNGNDADATINVTSHEHNETITDEQGNAWYDRQGSEDGDKCAWNFGSVSGNGYNQTINGNHYILQQEWSNASSGCVLTGR